MAEPFTRSFEATSEHIDQLGHVNNAVWVQWMEEVSVAHWEAVAPPEHQAAYVWVVTRHEIDYRGNIREGERVTATTWIPDPPKRATFDRCVAFRREGDEETGKVLVRARTTWAVIEVASGRLVRIPKDVAAPFWNGSPTS
ncbi:acyl-CoA thioesterase [Novosphingobium decolorationis]|uniref:Acyl-CoA thioesterase n=1 Tax=Novosphingobium decolorationis TaxID=2698673 RepID=A0ABX8E860_9SPHN|nr:acyl-CoA thioesterase [Novosphingobium decolorationis]QVM84973.1 acyl-CoA thioesterase [Novosphingobium decolorationis]